MARPAATAAPTKLRSSRPSNHRRLVTSDAPAYRAAASVSERRSSVDSVSMSDRMGGVIPATVPPVVLASPVPAAVALAPAPSLCRSTYGLALSRCRRAASGLTKLRG